jgi:hypothetical protein
MLEIPGDPVPIHALIDDSGVRPSLAADHRQALRAADLIIGEDVKSGRQFLVYGRAALAHDVGGGQTAWLRTLKIALDPETEELGRLLTLVQDLKGHHDYPGDLAELAPAVVNTILPDGTLDTRTTDRDPYLAESRAKEVTERQAALEALRRRGIPRPVAFVLSEDDPAARENWDGIVDQLRRRGIRFHSTGPAGVGYVVSVEEARKILRPFLGADAHLRFRNHTWPVGYWTVAARWQGFAFMESRTPQDMARAGVGR